MFGIDIYVFETLWPSLLGIFVIAGAMGWGAIKIQKLINDETKDKED